MHNFPRWRDLEIPPPSRKVQTPCLPESQVALGHGGTETYKKRTLVPFILPSTLITLQPFLLAADLAVKLHVDDVGCTPICALLVRTFDANVASWPAG